MTIKDIERMRDNLWGKGWLYAELKTPRGTDYLYFRGFDTLLEFVKKNFDSDLVSKTNSDKIVGVKIFRSN